MDVKKILLVEDDTNFGIVLRNFLEQNDLKVVLCRDGVEGLVAFKNEDFDLCILDIMMPRKDGFTLAENIRAKNKKIPIIFLTAKSLKADILKGYEIGADDYLNKPFDTDVLMHKIKVLFERKTQEDSMLKNEKKTFCIGSFTYDINNRTLTNPNVKPIQLSPKESKLLVLLEMYRNHIMPREMALMQIWRDDNAFTSRSMDVYIAKLRKYLKADKNVKIINIHGEGFRLIAK